MGKTVKNSISKSKISSDKFYNTAGIIFGIFLGGPLAMVYLIYQNYLKLGKKEEARKTLLIGPILVILSFVISASLPDDGGKSIYLVRVLIAYWLFKKLQGKDIANMIEKGGELHSFWNVLGVSILSLIISIVVMYFVFIALGNSL